MLPQLLIGIALGALIAVLAWKAGALSSSGAWAAGLTGGLTFGLGGLPWAALLLTFFISSSVLSRLFSARKAAVNEKFSKGSRRDWGQVFANGGLGTLLAVAFPLALHPTGIWVGFIGAMAAVNADTWATELGILSPGMPRLITNGKPVERGTSGGISWLGTLSALAGALLIGVIAAPFSLTTVGMRVILIASLGGSLGALFDSLLGATVQAIYWCPKCEKETERYPMHTCGEDTVHRRGWRWLNNDLVNFACSLAGALSAVGLWWLLGEAL
jgi:uncharacterized protein (TIGR00297 family)